jgi:predicted RNA-binding Zn ribbon-like protein
MELDVVVEEGEEFVQRRLPRPRDRRISVARLLCQILQRHVGAWADDHGVEVGDRAEAKRIRDAIRAIVIGDECPLPSVSLELTRGERGVGLAARTAVEAAVASSLILSIRGQFARVKLCGDKDCKWAFYDNSRNGSRTWCSMGRCGNRQKARTFRAKQPSHDEPPGDA